MRVAVLSLTRDRLDYTIHCFTTLHWLGGAPFDHYVLDQASTDGTVEWLVKQAEMENLKATFMDENVGLSRGHNLLLDEVQDGHDVVMAGGGR